VKEGIPPALAEALRADPFARSLGVELEEVREGYARASLLLAPHHRNFHGLVHGGVVFALADCAFAAASNARGERAVAVSATVHFLRAATEGLLLAECVEESSGRRLGSYRVEVRDAQGALVATMQALVYRQGEPVVPGGA
jgi:acyl-CoA thioesterase